MQLSLSAPLPMGILGHIKPQAGRPGLPYLKCIGRSNNNTAANSGLTTWAKVLKILTNGAGGSQTVAVA